MRTKKPPALSEAALSKIVIEIAHSHDWLVAHFTAARVREGRVITPVQADGAGFPDLVLVRERVVYAELKRRYKKPEEHQAGWIRALKLAGAEVHVWREEDLEEIETVLGLWCPRFAVLLHASGGDAMHAAKVAQMSKRDRRTA